MAERRIFFATAEQHNGERPHIVAECLGNILRLDSLVLRSRCPARSFVKTDSLGIIDIEHIGEQGSAWRSRPRVNTELLGIVNEVLFIDLLLLRQIALPQVTECIRAVVALNDLATSIDSRSAGICRYAAVISFGRIPSAISFAANIDTASARFLGCASSIKEHGVALSLHMGGLQLRSLNDSDTAFGQSLSERT